MPVPSVLRLLPTAGMGLLLAASLGAVLVSTEIGAARPAAGPFAKFAGNWRGGGQVVGGGGNQERITCRASYAISEGGEALTQSLLCASDSYRVDIRSSLTAEGEDVRGQWQEVTRGVSGDLAGQLVDGLFQGSVTGPGFTAGIRLESTGRKQQLVIRPQGGDITEVSVVLVRER